MTELDLDAIRKRANLATEGPWRVDGRRVVYERDGWAEMVTPILHVPTDAEFIAHARTDVPALLAHIAALTAEVREWADHRGVNIGDDDSEWWQGYRQAQRETVHDAAALADRIARSEATR